MPAPVRVDANRFVREMCRESYYQFFLEFWQEIAAEKLVASWYIKELADELQVIAERVFRGTPKPYDLIWNCPPGTSKSSVMSVLWQPWVWTRMPSARFITGSYAEKLALDLSRKSRDVIRSDRYRALFPEVTLREDQDTKGYFVNTKGGIRYAVGVGGSVLGMHAHFLGVDDPIDPKAALSAALIEEANTWMAETLWGRKVDKAVTPTVTIMQRLHQDDPTANQLAKYGDRIRHRCLPADLSWEVKPAEWRERYQDGLLDPIRLPRNTLDEAERVLLTAYAGQYGQEPVPRGGAMFKIDLIHRRPKAPAQWKRGPVRYWDKAGTHKGGAYTAGVLGGAEAETGRIVIAHCHRGQWDSGAREREITAVAQRDGRRVRVVVEQEPGSGGKESAEGTVRRLLALGFRAKAERPTGDKELRADPLSSSVNNGDVDIVEGPWNAAYLDEMRYFPVSKYKDQIDASSGMYGQISGKRYRIGAL